jgi:FemAB-related protein (PEP-CTERM system-associated)
MNAEMAPRKTLWDDAAANADAGSSTPISVTAADDSAADSWNEFVTAAPHAELYHDYRWRTLIAAVFGHECRYLLARDSVGQVRGVLPLVRLRSRLFGDFLVSVPYFNYGGLLADSPAVARALAEAAGRCGRDLGVAHVELRHRSGTQLDWPAREDKVTMRLELPTTEDALWKSFDSKLRAQIRRPEKAGATARIGGAELLGDFYSVFARNMRDLGTPVYPPRLFRSILAMFPEQAQVCVVDLAGKPVAAGLVLTHRSTMEIPWASSLREANRSSVNMLLYWSILRAAIAAGCQQFDFGRSSKDSGTYRFKEQWGAQAEQLRWHYWLAQGRTLPQITPNNPKYRLAIALWKKLPLLVANSLGPYIVKNLP